jgi:hypothetical protein
MGSFDAYKSYGVTSIPDNYILVTSSVFASHMDTDNMYGYGDGQILVIGRKPIPDVRRQGLGRYVIYRMKNGEYHSLWFPENKIQKILAETHIVVPPPPSVSTANQAQSVQASSSVPTPSTPENGVASNPSQPSTPLPTAQVKTATSTGTSIPYWICSIIVLSLGLIASVWYFLRPKK